MVLSSHSTPVDNSVWTSVPLTTLRAGYEPCAAAGLLAESVTAGKSSSAGETHFNNVINPNFANNLFITKATLTSFLNIIKLQATLPQTIKALPHQKQHEPRHSLL